MCILLYTTSHPDYPIILLSNRDEFLHRKTQRVQYWDPPHDHILSGRDLARPEKGTWLGISRTGRVAVLTNFREPTSAAAYSEKSRGAVVTSFLTAPEKFTTASDPASLKNCFPDCPEDASLETKAWIHNTLESGDLKGVGGFSVFCGTLRPAKKQNQGGEQNGHGGSRTLEPLAVISNRTIDRDAGVETSAHWVAGEKGETHGLSNSLFDDPWPKVEIGCQLLDEVVKQSLTNPTNGEDQQNGEDEKAQAAEKDLIERCFAVLSHDTLPKISKDDSYETEINALVHSVFIPPFDAAVEQPANKEQAKKSANGISNGTQKTDDTSAANSRSATPALESLCGGASTPIPAPKSAVQPIGTSARVTKAKPRALNVPLANSTHVDHIVATPVRPSYSERHPDDGEDGSGSSNNSSSKPTPTPTPPPKEIEEPIRKSPRIYGTQTQTVILVDNQGRVKYVERRLWDEEAKPVPLEDRERVVEFKIEGWEQ